MRKVSSHLGKVLLGTIVVTSALWAQPGNITTHPAPAQGPVVFDSAGNIYSFTAGPVTSGAAQTQGGGGTCLSSNGFFSTPGPCPDAYVGKLDPAGKLVFGTYLGGSTADQSTALALDAPGNVFITGSTGGSFPTTSNAAVATSTTAKAFAAKLSADGARLLYATYLPDNVAATSSISVDSQGQAYIGGTSDTGHAIAVKLNAAGSAFVYTVALGGTGEDHANAIAADTDGSAVIGGRTSSPDFPVSSAPIQRELKGSQNGFLAKLDSTGHVVFSTYFGGSGNDSLAAIEMDSAHNVYAVGQTTSRDFPDTVAGSQPLQTAPPWNNSGPGGFVAKIAPNGGLLYSSFVTSTDHAAQLGVSQLAVSASGEAYVAGLTGATFPVTSSAPQGCFDGPVYDAFVAHIDSQGTLRDATYAGQNVFSVRGLLVTADGSVLMVSDSAGASVESQIRFGSAGSKVSPCVSPSVLNGATQFGTPILDTPNVTGSSPITPGELITLTGVGSGPDTAVGAQVDAHGQFPVTLGGVQVLFDGKPAPLLYAQSAQINAQAPVEVSGQTQTNIEVRFNDTTIGTLTAPVSEYGAPGIFRTQPGGSTQAAATNQDGSINSAEHPAPRGSVVSVYGTGFGSIEPRCVTGGVNPPQAVNLAPGLGVLIAEGTPPGTPLAFAPVVYAGGAPFLPCGVVQINFTVPADAQQGIFQFTPWSNHDAKRWRSTSGTGGCPRYDLREVITCGTYPGRPPSKNNTSRR